MTKRNSIFLYGASGHARVVIDILAKMNIFTIDFLIDDDACLKNTVVDGCRVLGGKETLSSSGQPKQTLVAIGDNITRVNIAKWLIQKRYSLISAIDPSAIISKTTKLGVGSVIMMGAVINTGSVIGDNVIINTKAGIDHDCCIHSGVHIAPGSTICGNVTIGKNSFVGAGSIIIPNVTIGEASLIGAGTVIDKNVPAGSRIVGPRQHW